MTILLSLLACGGSQKPDPEPAVELTEVEPAPPPQAPVVQVAGASRAAPRAEFGPAVVDFTLDFHRALETDGNSASSGPSALIALSMLSAGARGGTLDAFGEAFGMAADDAWHVDNARLVAALGDTPGVELEVANGIWTAPSIALTEAFTKRVTEDYLAAPTTLDFAGDPDGAAEVINTWTRESTAGLIEELFSPGDLTGVSTVLANAIAFRGKWLTPFDAAATSDRDFATPSGQAPVPMMSASLERIAFFEGEGFRAVALPYAERRTAMIVLLPDAGVDLGTVEAALSPELLARAARGVPRKVNLALPRFEATVEHDLREPLDALGLGAIFGGGDFSGLSSAGLTVDKAIQKVFVKVDEAGTEAAAVTGITMKRGAAFPDDPVDFVVDRPFLWAIWHVETRTPVFTGRIVDPR